MIAIVQEKSKEIVNATAFAYASPGGANKSSPGAEALGKLARTTHERRRWRHAREIAFASRATAKRTTPTAGAKGGYKTNRGNRENDLFLRPSPPYNASHAPSTDRLASAAICPFR